VGIALAGAGGLLLADSAPHPAGGALLLGLATVLAVVRRSTAWTLVFVGSAFFVLHSLRQTESAGVRLLQELGDEAHALVVRGQVVSVPKPAAQGRSSFHLRLDEWQTPTGPPNRTRATVIARWRGDVQFGDEVRLFGVIRRTELPRNPGAIDMRRHLARRGIHHGFTVSDPSYGEVLNRTGGNTILRAAIRSREWLQATLSRGFEDSPELHQLISAMVLGMREAAPHEIEEQFQQTGTLHLFAVSGLHVGIIGYLLWFGGALLRTPPKPRALLVIPALFFYSAITGLNTSSIRAATMGAVLLLAVFAERPAISLNTISAAAVLILARDSNQLFTIGFQLSFFVVVSIILFADRLHRFFISWVEPDPFLPRALLSRARRFTLAASNGISRSASVSLAAWLGSVPLILPYFYLVTPVALFANVVVVPIAFCILAVAMLSVITTPLLPSLGLLWNQANWSLTTLLLVVVEFFTRAPAGHFYMEPRLPQRPQVEITVLDMGPGAAIHLRDGGADWLLDCGSARDFEFTTRAYLRSRGINRLDGVLLTHGDSLHVGGGAPVARALRPRQVIDNAAPTRSPVHAKVQEQIAALEIPRRGAAAGDEFQLSRNVQARVLFPPPEFVGSAADDQALVLQLTIYKQWRVLLVSDIGPRAEATLMQSGTARTSDIIIKGQHHSGHPGTAEFLQHVAPQLLIAAVPTAAFRGRLPDEYVDVVEAQSIHLLRQDETGAVTLRFRRDEWQAQAFRTGETVRRQRQ
jgi:competence protein ComEC